MGGIGAPRNVLKRIKTLFGRTKGLSPEQMAALAGLAPDARRAELGVVLHELCVRTAARFVEEESRRADSPFSDLPRSDLFHEMLVMNYWVFERLFKRRWPELTTHLYRRYADSFVWARESSPDELLAVLRTKSRTYDDAWDEYTGHQNAFARQAIGILFGGRQVAAAPQAAFWLISYADRTMKDFAEVRGCVDQLLQAGAGGV